MAKRIICGITEPSKDERIGSMNECLKMNQVRYWGLNKIDPRIVEDKKKKSDKKSKEIREKFGEYGELVLQMQKKGRELKKIKDMYKEERDSTKKKTNKESKTLKELKNRFEKELKQYESLQRRVEKARKEK